MPRHNAHNARKLHQPMLCSACVVGAIFSVLLWPSETQAIDLAPEPDLITDTDGYREWLSKSSNAKKYGAERVQDRDRTPFQPDGIRAGRFILLPSFGVTGVYDDNIFATDKNRQSDFYSELTPTIRIQSDFTRHAMRLSLSGKAVNYRRLSYLNYMDGAARFDGALHFDHAHTLSLGLSTSFLHDKLSDPLSPAGAREPISHWDNSATIALTRDAGRLYGTFSLSAKSKDYNDTRSFSGNVIDQDYRDSQTYSGQLRMGYRFSPGFELIAKTKILREFVGDVSGKRRDSYGYEGMAGLSFETSPLLRFHLAAGYGYRDYDSSAFKNLGAALFEGGVEWLPTNLLTLSATLRREIGQASASDGNVRIDTELRANLKYEIWRNLKLTVNGSITDTALKSDIRHDLTFGGGLSLEYMHTKNWAFNASYQYLERRSNESEFRFKQNIVRIGAKLRF